MTLMDREAILAVIANPAPGGDFIWDGQNEDDRPLSAEEMQAGVAAARKRVGRPVGSGSKEQVAIRLDRDVLAAFRATGPRWQTRINTALHEWLQEHSPSG
jgi:uncharacterized protein (DUF4415 family)